jgi:hypothetical protein
MEEQTSVEKLREILPEGSTAHYVIKHTTRGNSASTIDFFRFYFDPCSRCDGRGASVELESALDPIRICGAGRGASVKLESALDPIRICGAGRGASVKLESALDPIRICGACSNARGEVRCYWLSRMMSNACPSLRFDDKHEGIRVGGTGHNRALHALSIVSRALYGRVGALKMERL